jgi:hypothetical protein
MTLPEPPAGAAWTVLFDTSHEAPPRSSPILQGGMRLGVQPQSTVLLESRLL